jgi:hypothetical protein
MQGEWFCGVAGHDGEMVSPPSLDTQLLVNMAILFGDFVTLLVELVMPFVELARKHSELAKPICKLACLRCKLAEQTCESARQRVVNDGMLCKLQC